MKESKQKKATKYIQYIQNQKMGKETIDQKV